MGKPVEDGDDEEGEDKGGYKEGEDEHGHDHGDGGDDGSKDESRKDESSGDYNDDDESDNHLDRFADATSEANGTTETPGAEEKTLMVEQLVKINHKCIIRPTTVVVVNVIITTKCTLPNEGA
ncbi:hypothetical protein CMEL01_16393 [Colletotrichum melonis]|uniref:Uncharacterized protein n=1 Tax=Colletotrichum melonis TaxID=1209925 RepID=A0AAI9XQT3_9PEZI|nr:hypothetical protein CMEL01_16393 [Colletotrichum melonis]